MDGSYEGPSAYNFLQKKWRHLSQTELEVSSPSSLHMNSFMNNKNRIFNFDCLQFKLMLLELFWHVSVKWKV